MTWENGNVVHPNYYTMRIKKIMQELGIEKNIRFHDLRHTNATLLIQQQVDFKTLQKRLGHADFSTTMNIYAHVTEDMQRDATDKISSLLHKIK
jgi:integrase